MADMQEETAWIAAKVRGVLGEAQATQEDLRTLLLLSRDSISARVNGRIPFTGGELLRMARAFDVPIERFFPVGDEGRSTPAGKTISRIDKRKGAAAAQRAARAREAKASLPAEAVAS